MSETRSVFFRNAPLVRCVCRLSWEQPIALNVGRVVALQDSLKETFPRFAANDTVEAVPGIQVIDMRGAVTVACMENPEVGVTAIIQPNGLAVVWSKSTAPDGPPYPRFNALADGLENLYANLGVLTGGPPPLGYAVNITYADLLISGEGSIGPAMSKYFVFPVELGWPDGRGRSRNLEIAWKVDDEYDVRLQAMLVDLQGSLSPQAAIEGTLMQWTVGRFIPAGMPPRQALNHVHDLLLEVFMKSISKEAAEEWGLESDDSTR